MMAIWMRGLALMAVVLGTPLRADVALVIAAPEVERRGLLRSTDLDTRPALRGAGFDVISADVSSVEAMRAALSRLLDRVEDEDRVVVHLAGRFVTGAGRVWLLPLADDGGAGRAPNLAQVDGVGLSLDTVLAVVAARPGAAVVALGRAEDDSPLGAGLAPAGAADLAGIVAPQGVTLLSGAPAEVARLLGTRLVTPGVSPADLASGQSAVAVTGFVGRQAFLPVGEARPIAPPDPAEAERAIWQAAQAQDDLPAYRGYLDRYPQGLFAQEAQAAIDGIEAEPFRDARLIEEALNLDRDTRRRIQRELTVLGHEPRGVDGIFGAGSRAAIRRFQDRNGFPQTGFLDRIQIARLSLQAEARQAQIEAEAAREKLERERQDRAAWEATGSGADEAGMRAYLRRFPEGLFARDAKARLDEIDTARDRAAWDSARDIDTVAAYDGYLSRHPEGAFARQAQDRIATLTAPEPEPQPEPAPPSDAEAGEARLDLPQITLLLVERRLSQLGFDPGAVDGTLDGPARTAISRFQASKSLTESGYLDERTLAAMLDDLGGLGGLIQNR